MRLLSLLMLLIGITSRGVGQEWAFGPSLSVPRFTAACALLQNGNVLILGGTSDNSSSFASCELFDLNTRTIRPAASMREPRMWVTTILLRNGKLLAIGGYNNGVALNSCELYDPASNTWTSTGSMKFSRLRHAAALLPDGRVLVVGGATSQGGGLTVTSSCELYDPTTGLWSNAQNLPWARASHSMATLSTGEILLVGGYPYAVNCALFEPTTLTWKETGAPTTAFPTGENSLTLLPDGTVLLAGGWGGSLGMSAVCELYDPSTGRWSRTQDLNNRRAGHRAFLLPNGKVMIVGGHDAHTAGDDQSCFSLPSCEIYDPLTHTWSYASFLPEKPSYFGAALLPTGEIFIAGGGERDVNATPKIFFNSTVLFNPEDENWKPLPPATTAHGFSTLSALPNGRAILVGGAADCGEQTESTATELYDFASKSWVTGGNLLTARDHHTATLLTSNQLLIAGGRTGAIATSACELYDFVSNKCLAAPSMTMARAMHTATLLMNGAVLIVGGATGDLTDQKTLNLPREAELFSPIDNSWKQAAPLQQARYGHTATLLEDGRVFVAGGWNQGFLSSCEIYDPVCDSWSPAPPLPSGRAFHAATPLPGNRVIITGGQETSGVSSDALIFDANTNSWQSTGTLSGGRYGHVSIISTDGRVVIVGGKGTNGSALATAEVYDVVRNRWRMLRALPQNCRDNAACLLPNGSMLFAGGYTDDASGCHPTLNTFAFNPTTPPDYAVRPYINAVNPMIVQTGNSGTMAVKIAGGDFTDGARSASEASTGDYSSAATNHPIVALRRIGTDQLPAHYLHFDAGSSLWSDLATTIQLPLGSPGKRILPAGWYSVTLISNALPSITSFLRIDYTDQETLGLTTLGNIAKSCTDFTITASQTACLIRSIELDSAHSDNVRIEFTPSLPASQVNVHIRLIDQFRRGIFGLKINGSLTVEDSIQGAPQLSISQGSVSIDAETALLQLKSGCDSIILHNVTDQAITLPAGNFQHNTAYSIPPEQFPITIAPHDSAALMVCLAAIRPAIYQDTLVLENGCLPVAIAFKAKAGDSLLTGTDGCGNQIQASYIANDYLIKVSQPSPNPASDRFSIPVHTSEPALGQRYNTTCILYDMLGNAVSRATFEPTRELPTGEKIDSEGEFIFDAHTLPSGSYIATIYSESGTLSFPVHIVH